MTTPLPAPVVVPQPPAVPGIVEDAADRDVARLLRYGERFGAHRIDVRWPPLQLAIRSGAIAIFDPAAPEAARVLLRPVHAGAFRIMASYAIAPDAGGERLAALTVHTGRPPIAQWTLARDRSKRARGAAEPRLAIRSGSLAIADGDDVRCGSIILPCRNGDLAAYWAIDGDGKPVCLVVDCEAFSPKAWKAKPP